MAKHTPGPWRVYSGWVHPCFDHPNPQGTNDSTAICETLGPDKNANAHLIAAAPEMYEALEFCLWFINEWTLQDNDNKNMRNKAAFKSENALRKAEGRRE